MVMYFSLQNIRLLLFSLFCDLKLRKDEHEEYLIWLSYRKNKLTCHTCRDRFLKNPSKIKIEEKRKRLMQAIDYTNTKYGRNALSIAQAGLQKRWNIKKQYSSKIDTACFELLPSIRTS